MHIRDWTMGLASLAVASLATTAAGCGGARGRGAGGDMQAGSGDGGGAGSGGGGGNSGGGGGGGDGATDLAGAVVVSLGITQFYFVEYDSYSNSAFAILAIPGEPPPPQPPPAYTCTTTNGGGCSVSACVRNPIADMAMPPPDLASGPRDFATGTFDLGADMAPPLVYPNAGVIDLSGADKPLTLRPDADGRYPALSDKAAWWPKDQTRTITFHAAGTDRVPAFTIDITPPLPLTLTAPAVAKGSKLTVERAHDLVLQWSGGDGGTFNFYVQSWANDLSRSVNVSCVFDGAAHAATVPAARLQSLIPGMSAYINSWLTTTKKQSSGPVDHYVTSNAMANFANGTSLGGDAIVK
jgi:hypothetical protein